ncbi:SAM-dependent methyltransferase [Alteromonas sp. V450]|uniref:methyltransferase n=1 Tax=Alteromonas sp. V450 TaxID=1912139 RepID=UPI0008FF5443|nr:methyltransferase [Alteromonas sp. V450]OJF68103.1 SAM-dependent methyltransferase [Alteromonas sp. V450]
MNNDRIFDGIAKKFSSNIYGTTKGKLRHILLCDMLAPFVSMPLTGPLKIIEVGGGTGIMSAHLASLGHKVVLTDASREVLDEASTVLEGFSNVTMRQQYLADIDDLAQFDVVICHAVLEWLRDPYEAIAYLHQNMKDGALLSLSFFNQDANLFSNAIYGNFDYIEKGMRAKKQVRLNPNNPLSAPKVIEFCESQSFSIKDKAGIRCFHDYMRNIAHQNEKFDALLALERQYNKVEPYMWLGKYFHLILEK